MASDRNGLFLKAVFCPAFDSILSLADYWFTECPAWRHHVVAAHSGIHVSTVHPPSAFCSELFQGSSFPLLNYLKFSGNCKQYRLLCSKETLHILTQWAFMICVNHRTNYFPMQYYAVGSSTRNRPCSLTSDQKFYKHNLDNIHCSSG
jgi:hypothetical protein